MCNEVNFVWVTLAKGIFGNGERPITKPKKKLSRRLKVTNEESAKTERHKYIPGVAPVPVADTGAPSCWLLALLF